jgi:hypothetical protein
MVAKTDKLAGVARGCVVKYAGRSKASTGRDHRESSSISGHQWAMVARVRVAQVWRDGRVEREAA